MVVLAVSIRQSAWPNNNLSFAGFFADGRLLHAGICPRFKLDFFIGAGVFGVAFMLGTLFFHRMQSKKSMVAGGAF